MRPKVEPDFPNSYDAARQAFLEAARQAGARTASYAHPTARSPEGSPICIDVAVVGKDRAPKILLVISGTHGLEGLAGSASQIAFLRSGLSHDLPADVRVVLVHALNAWGFAHGSRTTENNVDLNRNFIDWKRKPPPNEDYAQLHGVLCPSDWNGAALERSQAEIDGWIAMHGRSAYLDRVLRGQYEFADGLGYGGSGPEWSNTTLAEIVRRWCVGAERVAVIDWHTGIGGYGEPFFLCFNAPGSELQRRCLAWWGQREAAPAFSEGEARPSYTGLVFLGIKELLSGAAVAGGVIEFGTRPVDEMLIVLRADRWLRFAPAGARSDQPREALRRDLAEAYCPSDPTWRAGVVGHAIDLQRRTLEGLKGWN
jgi:hypothetical protein